jgi:hypothetical protein
VTYVPRALARHRVCPPLGRGLEAQNAEVESEGQLRSSALGRRRERLAACRRTCLDHCADMSGPVCDNEPVAIPLGNLEPSTLAGFIYSAFTTAWDAMAAGSSDTSAGGNFMFARQAFSYLELACRTAGGDDSGWYLNNFASRRAERDRRYFTELPGSVPLPAAAEFRLPFASGAAAADRQLLAALFDTARHGLAHLYQQTPVNLTDGKLWMASFTGVRPGERRLSVDDRR